MFDHQPSTPLGPEAPIAEVLLAETAIRIELPPSRHRLAVERYLAVCSYLEGVDGPLAGRVERLYPQGSMAIGATIKARRRDDGYDVDIVAEIDLPLTTPPAEVLDALFNALNGKLGSLYNGKVKRQSRCVTIYYADGMHIDITPAVLLDLWDERKSQIYHAKERTPPATHYVKTMNSWAFCEHFKANTPVDIAFRDAYEKRVAVNDRALVADAQIDPVPDQKTNGGKSATLVAHQLLKRNRNLRYQNRRDKRMPPSVMMAALAVEVDVTGGSISEALFAISADLLARLEQAEAESTLIEVRNPKCDEDSFTDRWPENHEAQRLFIDDLKLFRSQLQKLVAGDQSLEQMQVLLGKMFGEGPVREAVKDHAQKIGAAVQEGKRSHLSTGRVVPSIALGLQKSPPRARAHTFYGGEIDLDEDH